MSKRATGRAQPASAASLAHHAGPQSANASQPPPGTDSPAQEVTGDVRWQMIAAEAFYRAEQRGFAPGCELEDWVAAEAQVDAGLAAAKE